MSSTTIIDAYEVHARHNRPDWAEFVAEAKDAPYEVADEIEHFAQYDLNLHPTEEESQAIIDAAIAWIETLHADVYCAEALPR